MFLLDILDAVDLLEDLQARGFPPNLRLHKLKGNHKGRYAIDVNKVEGWRITFVFKNSEFYEVKIENHH